MSKFKLTLDELKNEDWVMEVNDLRIFYREDVVSHLHRLYISFQDGRLELRDMGESSIK
ncbi:hypothetical protein [Ammoniphilus sp. 3BR4]|uniref:hypothetical protein n=1 Tax=Ammoniphilus sp. 3BR4 TaxID=3158265 RepID=UPI003467C1DB